MSGVEIGAATAAPGGVLGRARFAVPDLPIWSAAVRIMQASGREARLLCIGDSVTQGYGAVSGGWTPNGRASAWPERLAAMMSGRGLPASAASVAGAGAADGASGGYSSYDPRVTMGAGWGVNALTGMGGKLFSGAASSTGVWSFQPDGPVDRFDLWAVTNTALGVLTVETDGAVRATVSTTKAASMEVTTVAFPETTGPVSVRWASGGAVFIAGGIAWRLDVRRARVINAGWGGARIADWITTDQPYRAYGSIPTAAPDLSVVCLTINDWNAGTAVATYKAGLGTLVDRCLTTGDVLLMTGCPSDPAQGKASYAAQAALRDAVFEVAATRGLAAPIDGTALFGGSFAAGLMFDSVHPNAAGQARIAEAVRARMMI
ncbi:lysophospholipase L1-like esterase [Brevundimonas vesicularis]|uniref:SGNH/GDSL hydrolase family protein n=1 Tax=Brevundimonas vesicularis TaxID=41276 RepID=UPI00278B3868|nr:SGNH/GDSL hydrolase family protein [Brevundimonas vesicularis]MDQ1192044.1 lysophospholipase L1-like esterase [Brevundimonas vesicularis]